MKTKLAAAVLFIPLTFSQSFASENEIVYEEVDEGAMGLGIGSIIGGIFGGPVGIMLGGFTGALVGDSVGSDNEIQSLTSDLEQSNNTIASLQKNNSEQELALKDAKSSIEKLLTKNQELKLESLQFAVQFRTNSSNIEKHYQEQLLQLTDILNQAPEIEINVDGFADRMGDETYNMELSGHRATAVKEFLIQHGIGENRISTHAYGETKPVKSNESLDNNFFDRRVSISLKKTGGHKETDLSVAAN